MTIPSKGTNSFAATGEKTTCLVSGMLTLPPGAAFAEYIYYTQDRTLNSQLIKITLLLTTFSADIPH